MADNERNSRTPQTRNDEPGLPWFAQEEQDDKTTLRWAWAVALALHAVLLAVQLPELAANEPPPPEKAKVYVVEQVRFKQPPPPKTPELPPLEPTVIPYPDPTPDDLEPIREPVEVRPEIELPPDVIIDIPEGPPPSEDPVGPVPVGGDVTAPLKIYHPSPGYTEVARRARIEGYVLIQAVVDKQGNVVDAKILKGLPLGLDQEALRTVRTWKFEPATLNGKPVDVYFSLNVRFSLN